MRLLNTSTDGVWLCPKIMSVKLFYPPVLVFSVLEELLNELITYAKMPRNIK